MANYKYLKKFGNESEYAIYVLLKVLRGREPAARDEQIYFYQTSLSEREREIEREDCRSK
jgi:hypothetical protein